jgi:hypothetical protein
VTLKNVTNINGIEKCGQYDSIGNSSNGLSLENKKYINSF